MRQGGPVEVEEAVTILGIVCHEFQHLISSPRVKVHMSHVMTALPRGTLRFCFLAFVACVKTPFRVGLKIRTPWSVRIGLAWQLGLLHHGGHPWVRHSWRRTMQCQGKWPRLCRAAETQFKFRIPNWADQISQIGHRLPINFPKISGYGGYVGIHDPTIPTQPFSKQLKFLHLSLLAGLADRPETSSK